MKNLITLIRLRRAQARMWKAMREAAPTTALRDAPEGPAKEAAYEAIDAAVRLESNAAWRLDVKSAEVLATLRASVPGYRMLSRAACWLGLGEYL